MVDSGSHASQDFVDWETLRISVDGATGTWEEGEHGQGSEMEAYEAFINPLQCLPEAFTEEGDDNDAATAFSRLKQLQNTPSTSNGLARSLDVSDGEQPRQNGVSGSCEGESARTEAHREGRPSAECRPKISSACTETSVGRGAATDGSESSVGAAVTAHRVGAGTVNVPQQPAAEVVVAASETGIDASATNGSCAGTNGPHGREPGEVSAGLRQPGRVGAEAAAEDGQAEGSRQLDSEIEQIIASVRQRNEAAEQPDSGPVDALDAEVQYMRKAVSEPLGTSMDVVPISGELPKLVSKHAGDLTAAHAPGSSTDGSALSEWGAMKRRSRLPGLRSFRAMLSTSSDYSTTSSNNGSVLMFPHKVLEGVLPLSVPRFFDLFLSDESTFLKRFYTAAGCHDVEVDPLWQTAPPRGPEAWTMSAIQKQVRYSAPLYSGPRLPTSSTKVMHRMHNLSSRLLRSWRAGTDMRMAPDDDMSQDLEGFTQFFNDVARASRDLGGTTPPAASRGHGCSGIPCAALCSPSPDSATTPATAGAGRAGAAAWTSAAALEPGDSLGGGASQPGSLRWQLSDDGTFCTSMHEPSLQHGQPDESAANGEVPLQPPQLLRTASIAASSWTADADADPEAELRPQPEREGLDAAADLEASATRESLQRVSACMPPSPSKNWRAAAKSGGWTELMRCERYKQQGRGRTREQLLLYVFREVSGIRNSRRFFVQVKVSVRPTAALDTWRWHMAPPSMKRSTSRPHFCRVSVRLKVVFTRRKVMQNRSRIKQKVLAEAARTWATFMRMALYEARLAALPLDIHAPEDENFQQIVQPTKQLPPEDAPLPPPSLPRGDPSLETPLRSLSSGSNPSHEQLRASSTLVLPPAAGCCAGESVLAAGLHHRPIFCDGDAADGSDADGAGEVAEVLTPYGPDEPSRVLGPFSASLAKEAAKRSAAAVRVTAGAPPGEETASAAAADAPLPPHPASAASPRALDAATTSEDEEDASEDESSSDDHAGLHGKRRRESPPAEDARGHAPSLVWPIHPIPEETERAAAAGGASGSSCAASPGAGPQPQEAPAPEALQDAAAQLGALEQQLVAMREAAALGSGRRSAQGFDDSAAGGSSGAGRSGAVQPRMTVEELELGGQELSRRMHHLQTQISELASMMSSSSRGLGSTGAHGEAGLQRTAAAAAAAATAAPWSRAWQRADGNALEKAVRRREGQQAAACLPCKLM